MFILFLPIPIEKHDTIIQRQDGLQNRTDKIRGDRYRRQQGVRTHIEYYRQARGKQDDYGFEPRLRHHKQHQHNHHTGDDYNRYRRCSAILAGFHYAVTSETSADLLAQGLLVHRFRHIKVEDGMRTIGTITIGDAMDIGISLQKRTDTRHFVRTQTFEHHMHIGAGHLRHRTELGVHNLQAAFHL